jgi:mycoredoxin
MLTMYSTPWCGHCYRLATQLEREGVEYAVVDVEQDPAAAEFVVGVNGGNRTVPTVLFADGTTMTNPSIVQVREHLRVLAGRS